MKGVAKQRCQPSCGKPHGVGWVTAVLTGREEEWSGAAPASNLRVEKKPLAGVDACGLGLPARGWDQENQIFL